MHPKTFFVRLSKPFSFAQEAYSFYLHVSSREDALAWVNRVFPGIPMPALGSACRSPRVGNSDTVIVHDCDVYRDRQRIAGIPVPVETPVGKYRRSPEEVETELLKIFRNLQSERRRLGTSFKRLKRVYERDGIAWHRVRLAEFKAAYERALCWEASVWKEYLLLVQQEELVLPEPKVLAA